MTVSETAQAAVIGGIDHHQAVDRLTSTRRRVLMVVANPTTSSNNGWPVGFWAAELTHPYYELTEHGAEVTIARRTVAPSRWTRCPIPATRRNGRPTT